MSIRESCDKALLLQAEFDGELDAAQSAALNGHRLGCAYCQDAWETLQESRRTIRQHATYHPASAMLKERLGKELAMAGLDLAAEPVSPVPGVSVPGSSTSGSPVPRLAALRRWWRSLAGFGLGAAIAASAMMLVFQPPAGDTADLILASHIRSLQPGHLVDIASNNQHNVRPWFDGKLDFAPPVKNLADQGFPLTGGRLDYLRDRGVAALVYQAGLHTINLLIWPSSGDAETTPDLLDKGGYSIIHWQDKGMTIWAISDLNPAELQRFVAVWRAHG
jgi:anti-sigma factor RsiW